MEFGENNVLWQKYIDIYKFWGVAGGIHGPLYNCFIKKKTEKVQEHDLY